MPKNMILDEDGLEVYSYTQLDETVKYAYKVFTDDTKTSLLRNPTGFDTPDEALADMYAYLQSVETILSDEDGVVVYSYLTLVGGETKYGNRVYTDATKRYLSRETAGFDNQTAAEMDAKSFIYEMEGTNV